MPASAASPRATVMHCKPAVPAQTDLRCTAADAFTAASATLLKAGRGPKMRSRARQDLGTVGTLMIAGPSEARTVMSSSIPCIASAASRGSLLHPAHLPALADTCIKSAGIIIPHRSATGNKSCDRQDACMTFDPGGPWMRHNYLASGDLIALNCPEYATPGWIPGTGIIPVCGRDSYNSFDADDPLSRSYPSFLRIHDCRSGPSVASIHSPGLCFLSHCAFGYIAQLHRASRCWLSIVEPSLIISSFAIDYCNVLP